MRENNVNTVATSPSEFFRGKVRPVTNSLCDGGRSEEETTITPSEEEEEDKEESDFVSFLSNARFI